VYVWTPETLLWEANLGEGTETHKSPLFKNHLIIVQELIGTLTASTKMGRFSDKEGTKIIYEQLCGIAGSLSLCR
jgi:hypothetical protein